MAQTAKKADILNMDQLETAQLIVDEAVRKITLNQFTVETPDFFQLVQKKQSGIERIEEARKVIDIGSFVKNKVEMVMDTDYINSRVKEMTFDFNQGMKLIQNEMLDKVEQNFDPSKADSYSSRINTFFKEKIDEFTRQAALSVDQLTQQKKLLSEKIDDSFNPELKNSYLNKMMEFVDTFKSDLEKKFDVKQVGSLTSDLHQMLLNQFGPDGKLLKSIEHRLSFDNPDSVVVQLQNSFLKKLQEIKEEIVAGRSAVEAEDAAVQKSTLKGYRFEDILLENLERMAGLYGDLVEDVSNTIGTLSGSKKGDFIYTVTRLNKKIAIEAKSRPMSTPKKTMELMELTKQNREADYVIYITEREEHLHKQVGLFQEYEQDKLITHSGLLEIALKVAIARMAIENKEIEGIDRAAVESEINTIVNAIKEFRSIKTAVTNIRKDADRISSTAEYIKTELNSAVTNLSDILLEE